jgi:hypothetical protein
MELRALSVKQPWAGLLMAGVKRFECRTWQPKQPGPFLLHVSSGKAAGMPELRAEPLFQRALRKAGMADEGAWPQSSFLGLVEIAGIIAPDDDLPKKMTELDEFLSGGGDGAFLWQIGRRWVFPRPIPCHGKLGLWRPPEALRKALDEQLAASGAPVRIGAAQPS